MAPFTPQRLPAAYADLAKEPGPKMLVEALKFFGLKETPGSADNAVILGMAKAIGQSSYTHDSIPWCGLFMGYVAKATGTPVPKSPLWALSWREWGTATNKAELGDVLVFVRPSGGHVGLYVGEDKTHYHVLGGNQGDAVKIVRVEKARCRAIRRLYAVAKPGNVRAIRRAADGAPRSTNEA